MTATFTGGCMCKAIRYECSIEPIGMGICYCRDCQKATGSAFASATENSKIPIIKIREFVRRERIWLDASPL